MNEEIEIRENKTPCQTIVVVDGEEILKDKKKLSNRLVAYKEALKLNAIEDRTEMLQPYNCQECGKWHLGRNGEELTEDSRARLISERVKIKVVGKIDLSQFEKKSGKGWVPKVKKKVKQPEQPKNDGLFSVNKIKLTILGKIDLPK